MYLHPNWLVIDWTEKKKSMERVKASKTVQSKPQAKEPSTYKSVNDYKPTGSSCMIRNTKFIRRKNKTDIPSENVESLIRFLTQLIHGI